MVQQLSVAPGDIPTLVQHPQAHQVEPQVDVAGYLSTSSNQRDASQANGHTGST